MADAKTHIQVNATCPDTRLNKLHPMAQLPWKEKSTFSKFFYSPEHIAHCLSKVST